MSSNKEHNNQNRRPDDQGGGNRSSRNQPFLAFLICLLISLVLVGLFTRTASDPSREITYDKFIDMIDKDQIQEVIIEAEVVRIKPKTNVSLITDSTYYVNKTEEDDALVKRLQRKGIVFSSKAPDVMGEIISMIISIVLT